MKKLTKEEKFYKVATPIKEKLKSIKTASWDKTLKSLGFTDTTYLADKCRSLYVCEKRKILIKLSYLTCKQPKKSIPTLFIRKDGFSHWWIIQPICLKKKGSIKFLKEERDWNDMAYRNCGWWNGKPVIFDW